MTSSPPYFNPELVPTRDFHPRSRPLRTAGRLPSGRENGQRFCSLFGQSGNSE